MVSYFHKERLPFFIFTTIPKETSFFAKTFNMNNVVNNLLADRLHQNARRRKTLKNALHSDTSTAAASPVDLPCYSLVCNSAHRSIFTRNRFLFAVFLCFHFTCLTHPAWFLFFYEFSFSIRIPPCH